jgi:acyl-CoA synthetase (NDP forming)
VLNVRDGDALFTAIAKIRQATNVDRVLVQPVISGLDEVLIGYRVDSDVGPLVMLAAGGILAEIHRDRSLRLAPVDLAEAKAMIGEVAALKALAGYRGKPAGDLDALAQALVSLSKLAVQEGPAVAEAEVNPLIVRPKGEGVLAVDALVKIA